MTDPFASFLTAQETYNSRPLTRKHFLPFEKAYSGADFNLLGAGTYGAVYEVTIKNADGIAVHTALKVMARPTDLGTEVANHLFAMNLVKRRMYSAPVLRRIFVVPAVALFNYFRKGVVARNNQAEIDVFEKLGAHSAAVAYEMDLIGGTLDRFFAGSSVATCRHYKGGAMPVLLFGFLFNEYSGARNGGFQAIDSHSRNLAYVVSSSYVAYHLDKTTSFLFPPGTPVFTRIDLGLVNYIIAKPNLDEGGWLELDDKAIKKYSGVMDRKYSARALPFRVVPDTEDKFFNECSFFHPDNFEETSEARQLVGLLRAHGGYDAKTGIPNASLPSLITLPPLLRWFFGDYVVSMEDIAAREKWGKVLHWYADIDLMEYDKMEGISAEADPSSWGRIPVYNMDLLDGDIQAELEQCLGRRK